MATRLPPNDPKAAIAWLKKFGRRGKPGVPSVATVEKSSPSITVQLDQLAAPRVDAAEAVRRMEATGATITLYGSESHSIKGARGHFLFEGSGVSDEMFANDPLGALNISKAWLGLRRICPQEVYRFSLDDGLLHQLTGSDLEVRVLETMTAERRDLPVLFAYERRGMFLIDGGHRILARAMKGISWVHGFVVNEIALADIRVRIWKLGDDGSRAEIDTTKGYSAIFG